ncbi:MAG: rhodanese-like domain-containing protein [Deltaproteobacteria bacterium]|nr:MAG: rhodanese-like domain-containing protein [Deltaproteobacteria bacterium]
MKGNSRDHPHSDLERNNVELQHAVEKAKQIQSQLDRQVFYLKTLYDLTSELSPIVQTERLLETFLLMTIGTYGISQGFVLLLNRETRSAQVVTRGMEKPKGLSAEAAESLLYQSFNVSEDKSLAPMTVSRITAPELLLEAGFDIKITCSLMFVIDPSLMGLVAFGTKLSPSPLSSEDEGLLFALVSNFMVFLKTARSFETIQTLNADLERRNQELRQTIAELTEARHTITVLEKAKNHIKSLVQWQTERIGRLSLLDVILILTVSIVVGLLFNISSPNGVTLLPVSIFRQSPPVVTVLEAKRILDEDEAVLVDARPFEFYKEKHIKEAINVPPSLFDIVYMMKLSNLDPQRAIVVYGRNISRHYDEEVAHRLMQRDHQDVRVLTGGLSAWAKHGYPVEQ